MMKQVVLVTNIPTPFRVPLFNELASAMEKQGMHLHVIFGASTYSRRMHTVDASGFRFSYTFLDASTISRRDKEKTTFLYNGLATLLNKIKPDAIIVSGFSPATLKVCMRQIVKGTPFLVWNGSIVADFRKEGLFKNRMRKWLVSRAAGFIAYGTRAKEYLVQQGAEPDAVEIAINTVDTDFFRDETDRLRKQLPGEPVYRLLSVGYLSPRKGAIRLIDLMRVLSRRRKDIVLDIVGDGEERAMLERRVKEYGLNDLVRFHGFVPRERLPEHMAKASVFLFHTEFDIWGLVVNEAMASGLPVICSPNAGSARDLIKEGSTGFVRDFHHPETVADLVENLVDQTEFANRIGKDASRFITENVRLADSAQGFISALKHLFKIR
ncbi:MAG: glycosyltransferase family 4 protein [Bacteroidota bacterium]